MLESRIARRYLWAARKQRHTAFLSLISTLGLAVGVATLLISLALLSGLQGEIKQRLIDSSPTILIEPAGGNTVPEAQAIGEAAARLGMKEVVPVISGTAWAANELTGRGRPMRVRSYRRGGGPPAGRRSVPAAEGETEIFTTRELAASLGLDLGSVITVVAPRTRLTPFGPVPVWKQFRISGFAAETAEQRQADAWLSQDEASSLFATAGRPTSIELYGNAALEDGARAALAARFPAAQVKTWKEINRPLFLALRLEKIVMFVTISLIVFVAALNLISSLSMLIAEKRPQVGVLRTLGATERTILLVFLQVGLLTGLAGTLLGNVLGLGTAWAADHFRLISLEQQAYFVSYLPFKIEPSDVIGVNAVAILLSVVATWYPARIASRLDPIAAIRDGN